MSFRLTTSSALAHRISPSVACVRPQEEKFSIRSSIKPVRGSRDVFQDHLDSTSPRLVHATKPFLFSPVESAAQILMAAELQYRGVSIGNTIGYPHFTETAEQVAAPFRVLESWGVQIGWNRSKIVMIAIKKS